MVKVCLVSLVADFGANEREGIDTAKHSATLAKGTLGVLHGVKTYLLQTISGQITETHSISAGLDYPYVKRPCASSQSSSVCRYTVALDQSMRI